MEEYGMLNGNWIGFYEYGTGYPEEFKGKRIFFKAAIGQSKTNFIGRVTEKNETGEKEYISIKGSFFSNRIIFTKHHKKFFPLDKNFEIIPSATLRDIDIYYRGEFIEYESKFIGKWESPEFDAISGGIWEMWKNPAFQ